MSKSVIITLTTFGTDTGPFDLYSDVDSYAIPFETGVLKNDLISGYTSNVVPNAATIVRVMSAGECTNYIDLNIIGTTTTTTSTTTSTTTTSALLPLKLILVDPLIQTVADPTNVDDWNEFFQLPVHGNPFTLAVVISEYEVWLYGASLIMLPYDPFGDQFNIVSIIDDAECIIALLNDCFEYNDQLTTVSLPACRYSNGGSFDDCTALTSLNIPNLVSAAGDFAFYGVPVTSFNLPLLEVAGNSCFRNCLNVTSFDLPSLTSIGNYLFSGCASMTSYNVPALPSSILNIADGTFMGCSSMASFDFPNAQVIGDNAFKDCTTSIINIPNATYLGNSAFENCIGITSFIFPFVTYIGNRVFADCVNATSFSLPLVTSADYYAFGSCTSATSFNLPLLASCGFGTFALCTAATSFNLSSCTNLGGSVGDDYTFGDITGNAITLTIPSFIMTCNLGNPDGDVQTLQANNTVTLVVV